MLLNEGVSWGRSTTIVSLVLLHNKAGFSRSRTTRDLEEKTTKKKPLTLLVTKEVHPQRTQQSRPFIMIITEF